MDDDDDFALFVGLFEGEVVLFVDDPGAVRGLALEDDVDAFSLPRLSKDDDELTGLADFSLGLS